MSITTDGQKQNQRGCIKSIPNYFRKGRGGVRKIIPLTIKRIKHLGINLSKSKIGTKHC
jgi:hypothetical protein